MLRVHVLREALARARWRRAIILFAVLGAHLLVLELYGRLGVQTWQHRTNTPVARPEPGRTIVLLLEPQTPFAIKPGRDAPQTNTRPTPRERARNVLGPVAVFGSEASNAAAVQSVAPASPPLARASAEAPAPAGTTLNLTLSRDSLKALEPIWKAKSPFQGSQALTVERRIAEATGETGAWTEERIDADHIRLRRGNTCLIATRPQAAKIDPLSESSSRIPWGVVPSECR